MSAVPLIAPLTTPDRILTGDGCVIIEDGCLLITPEDTTQCACCGTPPPPPPPPACCDVSPPSRDGCCFTTGTSISITVTALLSVQDWACNNNALCGTTGWKSLTLSGSGSGTFTFSVVADTCCPSTFGAEQIASIGSKTTFLDLPTGPPCGGGVQSVTGYTVRVSYGFTVISGINYTVIQVIGALGTHLILTCSSGTSVISGNNGTRFSSSCGTSPGRPYSESISVTVTGLAPCSDGGGGGGGFVFI